MISQILGIARNTLVESLRQPIFFVMVMVSGMLQWLNTASAAYSMGYTTSSEVSGDDKLLLDIGMGTIFLFGTLLAAFQATAVISREIVDKTVLTVVAKPVDRPTIVLGKYVGVAIAILMAVAIMVTFLLFGIRHEVMSTASDEFDMPVVVFLGSAIALSGAIAVFGNFFYGWSFPQVAMTCMFPLVPAAYVATLLFDKEWHLQPIATDFKPSVFVACLSLTLAVLVLTAIATAVSTRLGQVMTIVVCSGVFVIGLLSNHLLGQAAFKNEFIAVIETAEPTESRYEGFATTQARYEILFDTFPDETLSPGEAFYYGPSPTGFAMAVPAFEPIDSDGFESRLIGDDATPPAVVIAEASGRSAVVVQAGGRALGVERAPQPGDYVFTRPTETNPIAMAAWGVVPNMHYFWLLDAVTQNRVIPSDHLARIGLYSVLQIAAFLALAVILFQRRDVG
ncbi:MAG: ABC transporter permease subunit [Planctomycetota bacterium]